MSGTTSGVIFTKVGEDVHMRLFRGKTLRFEIVWGGETPIDITGCQAVLQARSLDGTLMLDLSSDNGGIVIDGPAGLLRFAADPVQTDLVRKVGRYELELTTLAGDVYRVISGAVTPIEEQVL